MLYIIFQRLSSSVLQFRIPANIQFFLHLNQSLKFSVKRNIAYMVVSFIINLLLLMAIHKTSVKMVNMRVVKLTYRVTPHLIISGTAGKKK